MTYRTHEKVNEPWKQAVVNDFLRGQSVATIAQQSFCHKLRVEQVLREAIKGLAAQVRKAADMPKAEEQTV